MTGGTHFFTGALVGAAMGMKVGAPLEGAALGGFAALLPDIDHPGSALGRFVRPIAVVLEAIGHRSITHTLWFCLGISLALTALFGKAVFFWIFLLGSLSHIILDSLTRSGTTPLFPPFPFHIRGPFVTGNILSEGVISAIAVFMLIKILSNVI